MSMTCLCSCVWFDVKSWFFSWRKFSHRSHKCKVSLQYGFSRVLSRDQSFWTPCYRNGKRSPSYFAAEWVVMCLKRKTVFSKSGKSFHQLCWCFKALRHFSGHFGRGLLTYRHCSSASLLGSSPVFSSHSFASNWQLPFLNQRKGENAVGFIAWPIPMTEECCRTWGSNQRPHTRRTSIRPSYRARLVSSVQSPLYQTLYEPLHEKTCFRRSRPG